jgi:hypothetical protein
MSLNAFRETDGECNSVLVMYPAAMTICNPFTGLLPIEQALLNVGDDGSLENTDAVDALLRENPAFLEQLI